MELIYNKISRERLILTLVITFLLSNILIPFSVNANGVNNLSQKELEVIANEAYYNKQTGLYEYNVDKAIENGADQEHAKSMGLFLESLSKKDVEEFNKMIGFDPSNLENQKNEEISPQALPLVLIPIAKFLAGAAGAVIVAEVTLYGIAKACQNLEGKYNFFDDFCETRGYI